jgi:apolipoprotein N-acyltransferase
LDFLLAFVSGLFLAASFPRFGHPACAWIALVPLLIALSGWRGRPGHLPGQPAARAFALGLVAGATSFVGTMYWTGWVVTAYGGLPLPLAPVVVLLVAAYLGLFPAVAALILSTLIARLGQTALLLTPAVWVATEYLRGQLFGGFPWVPLGNSQVSVLSIAQLASALGVHGLSALVSLVNAALAFALLSDSRRASVRVVSGTFLCLGAVAVWGTLRVADASLTQAGTPIRIGLVQGNVAQQEKWDPRQARRILTTYIAMTRHAVREGAEYVIWPESSTPFPFEHHDEGTQAVRELAREVGRPILLGSDQHEPGDPPALYNAAYLVSPDGQTAAVYRKMRLVPFGEFVPFGRLLSFVRPLVPGASEFSPGSSMVMLPIGSRLSSTAICYEVVYPSLARDAVHHGSELLTTITNDAWYDRSSAPYQHFELASMRAIEQGRYLARAANTGISGFVDPYGRVLRRSRMFEQTVLVEEVRFLTERTAYSLVGDIIAYAAIAVTLVAVALARTAGVSVVPWRQRGAIRRSNEQ